MCLDVQFHGAWHTNLLNIEIVERVPDVINLAVNMQALMQELCTSYTKSYLIIFFEHKSIVRPTYAIVQPGATFNLATVRAHVLES